MSLLPRFTELGILEIIEVYEYYDAPCLFSCRNEREELFFVVWSDIKMWLYAPITEKRLIDIKANLIELRDIFTKSPIKTLYTKPFSDLVDIIEKIKCEDLLEDWLPMPNEYLDYNTSR